jgi:hypothetical protein
MSNTISNPRPRTTSSSTRPPRTPNSSPSCSLESNEENQEDAIQAIIARKLPALLTAAGSYAPSLASLMPPPVIVPMAAAAASSSVPPSQALVLPPIQGAAPPRSDNSVVVGGQKLIQERKVKALVAKMSALLNAFAQVSIDSIEGMYSTCVRVMCLCVCAVRRPHCLSLVLVCSSRIQIFRVTISSPPSMCRVQ